MRVRLAGSVSEWYKDNPNHLGTVLDIVRREKSGISLRILEHFVTNYTQRHRVLLPNPKKSGELMDVFWAYKEALKCFHKTLFDPFCRSTIRGHSQHETINIADRVVDGLYRKNTGGKLPSLRQLNFFRWAIAMGVLDYVSIHLEDINEDMNSFKNATKTTTATREPQVSRVPSFAGAL